LDWFHHCVNPLWSGHSSSLMCLWSQDKQHALLNFCQIPPSLLMQLRHPSCWMSHGVLVVNSASAQCWNPCAGSKMF
jgi:hypothetical protein